MIGCLPQMLSFHFVVMTKTAKYAYDVNAPAVRAGLLFLVCVFLFVWFFFLQCFGFVLFLAHRRRSCFNAPKIVNARTSGMI